MNKLLIVNKISHFMNQDRFTLKEPDIYAENAVFLLFKSELADFCLKFVGNLRALHRLLIDH